MSSFRRLLPYLLRYRLRYLGGAACLLLATVMSVSIPWTVKRAVDTLERDGAAAHVAPFVLLILALRGGVTARPASAPASRSWGRGSGWSTTSAPRCTRDC